MLVDTSAVDSYDSLMHRDDAESTPINPAAASSASGQADQLRARNVAMERDVASLELELKLITEPAFVSQMARGYELGSPREIPFTIDPNAPPLPSNAAGSVGIKPEQPTRETSPLDSWMQALFGAQT